MKNIIALSSVPLVMTLRNSMLIPVLPMMEKKLSVTSFQVSLIITVYSVVAIICIPIAGYLSDRFGRKNIAAMPPHCRIRRGGQRFCLHLYENPYAMILAGRVLQGIGSAGAALSSCRLSAICLKETMKRSAPVLAILKPPTHLGRY